jgi:hypothetical protein
LHGVVLVVFHPESGEENPGYVVRRIKRLVEHPIAVLLAKMNSVFIREAAIL